MNWILQNLPDDALCHRIVQVFGHFLWEGALIAGVVWLGDARTARWTAAIRYRVLLVALLLLTVCPFATFGALRDRSMTRTMQTAAPPTLGDSVAQVRTNPSAGPGPRVQNIGHSVDAAPTQTGEASAVPFARWLLLGYLLGVAVMLSRLSLALGGASKLIRGSAPSDESLRRTAGQLAARLGLARVPRVAQCVKLATPAVVGMFRPMVLLPVSLAADLSPIQVEAILAHELAHIRRHDHLINLLQRVIEAVLFFHPAVWFISARLRAERELCCDDMVIALGTPREQYAAGLLAVASYARLSTRVLALGAAGKPSRLRHRVARLLDAGSAGHSPLPRGRGAAAAILLLLVVAMLLQLLPRGRQSRAAADPRLLTVAQLLERVRAERSKVEDLFVIADEVAVKGGEGSVIHQERTVILKGSHVYMGDVYDIGKTQFNRILAYDGRRTMRYEAAMNQVAIQKGRPEELNLKSVGFFSLNLLCPPQATPGSGDESLLSLLALPGAKAREQVEVIDGHPCEVVDVYGTEKKTRTMTVWLDLDRGLMPIKHCRYLRDEVLMQFVVEKAMQLPNGMWLATRGTKDVFHVGGIPEIPAGGIQYVIVLGRGAGAKPPLEINRGVPDSTFDLLQHLPPGTRVVDIDTQATSILGMADARAAAIQPAEKLAPLLTPPAPAASQPAVKWQPEPWGEATEGLACRITRQESSPHELCLDIRNQSGHSLPARLEDFELELDGKWYHRPPHEDSTSWFTLYEGRTFQTVGPILFGSQTAEGMSFGSQWADDKGPQDLRLTPGAHTVRLRVVTHCDTKDGPVIRCTSARFDLTVTKPGRKGAENR
ncbi:MAG TPA: M56 family metallopeptidase [Tepidisphaeraceae bacterium]|jgi:beta-lactamase regulating signal transducer with metallopeptidase domain|nr:M56 family metallopeptidase [Tepidisphaeraceae bacterium]